MTGPGTASRGITWNPRSSRNRSDLKGTETALRRIAVVSSRPSYGLRYRRLCATAKEEIRAPYGPVGYSSLHQRATCMDVALFLSEATRVG
jgi:hypothetical protein